MPAFNNFREDRTTLWDSVSLAAACSFFAAIHQGRLRVEVAEPGVDAVRVLDSEAVAKVLEHHRERKRRRSRSTLSGERAFGTWETLKTGSRHALTTRLGAVAIHLRHPAPSGVVRVDLCRNGMWIVDRNDIPGYLRQVRRPATVRGSRPGRRRDGRGSPSAHPQSRRAASQQLVHKASFEARGQGICAQSSKAIRERIHGLVPEVGADTYSPG